MLGIPVPTHPEGARLEEAWHSQDTLHLFYRLGSSCRNHHHQTLQHLDDCAIWKLSKGWQNDSQAKPSMHRNRPRNKDTQKNNNPRTFLSSKVSFLYTGGFCLGRSRSSYKFHKEASVACCSSQLPLAKDIRIGCSSRLGDSEVDGVGHAFWGPYHHIRTPRDTNCMFSFLNRAPSSKWLCIL